MQRPDLEIITLLFCRFLGLKKIGGSGLKASVAAAVVVSIWIYIVAFNIPVFLWSDARIGRSGRIRCSPRFNPVYVLAARILNFYVPLVITWTSNIGIIYKFRRATNKVTLLHGTDTLM